MKKWARRVLSISILTIAWLFWGVFFPFILGFALWSDFRHNNKQVLARFSIYVLWFLTCEILGVLCSLVIWLFCIGGLRQSRFYQLNFALQRSWAGALFWGIVRVFDMQVKLSGHECLSRGQLILLARHVSSADSLLPSIFVSRAFHTHLRFVMKDALLWDPCLDIVGNRLPNCFIRRDRASREQTRSQIRTLVDNLGATEGIVFFPEGTRFTQSKRKRILEGLKNSDKVEAYNQGQALKNVLPPRRSGVLALLEANPGADVVFVAHCGLETVHNLKELRTGSLVGRTIQIHFWRVPYQDIPTNEDERMQWIWKNWAAIDKWIVKASSQQTP